jgi:hypothetical protein
MASILAKFRSKRQEQSLPDQVRLLIAYAAEHHLLTGSTPEQDTALQSRIIAPLMAAMQKYNQDPGNPTNETDLLVAYSRLVAQTGEATGRSIFDSENSDRTLYGVGTWTAAFGVLVLITQSAWVIGHLGKWQDVVGTAALFFWGGLGSCVFLMKSLSDRVADHTFDSRLLQGYRTRIMLGGLLGAIIPFVFKLGPGTGEVNAAPAVVAFLSGLSIKVVYGALENTIDALAQRFNLGSIRKSQASDEAGRIAPITGSFVGQDDKPPGDQPGIKAGGQVSALANNARRSVAAEIIAALSGLGRYAGPITDELNPDAVQALQGFLGNNASSAEVTQLPPQLLLQWVRQGRTPADWRNNLSAGLSGTTSLIFRSADEIAANLKVLEALQKSGEARPSVNKDDPAAVDQELSAALRRYVAKHPELKAASFTQIVKVLTAPST